MASPSPKRRRTSPDASVPVNASNTDLSDVSNDTQVFSHSSYMTPTKASLARFHPHLIPQSSQSTTPRSKGRLLLAQRSSTLKGSRISPSKVPQFPRPGPIPSALLLNSVARASTDPPRDVDFNQAGEFMPTATHVAHSNSSNGSATTGPTQHFGDHEPRASPPTEAAGEGGSALATVQDVNEDVADVSREASRSRDPPLEAAVSMQSPHLKSHGIVSKLKTTTTNCDDGLDDDLVTISTPTKHKAAEDDEPKLPSTPRQLGIEPPGSKPTGILSISPSRNSRRRRASNTKSSPLKPRNAAPVRHIFETELETTLGPRRDLAVAFGEAAPALGPLGHHLERDSCILVMPTYSISKVPETDPLYDVKDTVSLDCTVSDVASSKGGPGTALRDLILHSPSDTLVVEIRMFLKDSGKVTSITVITLTSWASELGKWLNAPIADRSQDCVVRAICRFWDMAETRAFCWHNCQAEFKHLFDKPGRASVEIVSEIAGNLHGKLQENGEPGSESRSEQPESSSFPNVLAAETLYHCMGLNSIRISDSVVALEVRWAVNFAPSGKVTSRVSSHTSFPPSWAEDRDDLRRTDEAFKRLIQSGKPVFEAISCIVDLLFPN